MKSIYTIVPINFLLLLIALAGCNKRSDTLFKLDHIDAIIQAHPDSALTLLNEINPSGLREGEEKAKYGLLLTMAEDKNYLDPMNDSIILYASEYFTGKGDMLNRIRSDYYRGSVLYHREDFPSALISYFKAKDAAEKANEYFWEGMSYRGISHVYLKVSASADELHYAKKEYESIKKSGIQPYLNYALADLARAYNNNDDDIKTIELSDQLLDSASLYNDPILNNEALQLKAGVLFWMENYIDALPLLEKIYESGYGENRDSIFYFLSNLRLKNYEKLNEDLSEIKDGHFPYKDYLEYNIYKENGDYKKALEELENYNIYENDLFKNKGKVNLASNLNKYYEFEKDLNEKEIKLQRYKIWLIITVSSFTFLLLILLIISIIGRYKRELDAKILFMEQLDARISETEKRNEASDMIIRNLFGNQFSIIKTTCEILYRNPDSIKAKRQVTEYISKLVEELSVEGKLFKDIENQIDKTYNGVLNDLKTDISKINQIDYSIYLFSMIGFPSDIIAYLLKLDKVETVYNRKRHLKERIKKLDPVKSQRYLNFI